MTNYLDSYFEQFNTISINDFEEYEIDILNNIVMTDQKEDINLNFICWFFNDYAKTHEINMFVFREQLDYFLCEESKICTVCNDDLNGHPVY